MNAESLILKLTWFGNTAFRIHIGGQIVVIDADAAPAGVDRTELVSAADLVVGLNNNPSPSDLESWRPRRRERLLDSSDTPRPVQVWSAGQDCLLIDADEDMPLLLAAAAVPELGRWAESAVVVLVGKEMAVRGGQLIEHTMPRLIALAGGDGELDAVFAQLPARLDGTGLVALEPGLAVEV